MRKLYVLAALLFCLFKAETIKTQITQIYTENDVFVVPDGVYSITVECIGGGGGGARAATAYRGRGGGGGGAYAKSILSVTPFEEFSIEIGGGGAGGTSLNGGDGAAGGSSIFGNNLVLAVGGHSRQL